MARLLPVPLCLTLIGIAANAAATTARHTDPAAFQAALSGIEVSAGFDGLTPGSLVPSGATAERIIWSYSLGGETLRVSNAFDTPSPANSLGLSGADSTLLDGDAVGLGFPAPVLAVGIFIVASDPVDPGEIALANAEASVASVAAPVATLPDGGRSYFLGLVSDTGFSTADLLFANDGGIHFLYSLDEITTAVAVASNWIFSGVAVGGYTTGSNAPHANVQPSTVLVYAIYAGP